MVHISHGWDEQFYSSNARFYVRISKDMRKLQSLSLSLHLFNKCLRCCRCNAHRIRNENVCVCVCERKWMKIKSTKHALCIDLLRFLDEPNAYISCIIATKGSLVQTVSMIFISCNSNFWLRRPVARTYRAFIFMCVYVRASMLLIPANSYWFSWILQAPHSSCHFVFDFHLQPIDQSILVSFELAKNVCYPIAVQTHTNTRVPHAPPPLQQSSFARVTFRHHANWIHSIFGPGNFMCLIKGNLYPAKNPILDHFIRWIIWFRCVVSLS